jgi:hypothetical protein
MKLLIAIDGSDFSQAALRSVIARPWPPDTEVKVLHVDAHRKQGLSEMPSEGDEGLRIHADGKERGMLHDTMCPSSVFNSEEREIPEPKSFQSYDPARRMRARQNSSDRS